MHIYTYICKYIECTHEYMLIHVYVLLVRMCMQYVYVLAYVRVHVHTQAQDTDTKKPRSPKRRAASAEPPEEPGNPWFVVTNTLGLRGLCDTKTRGLSGDFTKML